MTVTPHRALAADYFQEREVVVKIDLSWHVSSFGCPRNSLANEISRLLELTPKPAYVAEIKWRRGGGMHAEAELGIAIARRIIYL